MVFPSGNWNDEVFNGSTNHFSFQAAQAIGYEIPCKIRAAETTFRARRARARGVRFRLTRCAIVGQSMQDSSELSVGHG